MGEAAVMLEFDPAERIVVAYLLLSGGDAHRAIRALAHDALADLCEAERRCGERDRLISAGYVRRPPPGTM